MEKLQLYYKTVWNVFLCLFPRHLEQGDAWVDVGYTGPGSGYIVPAEEFARSVIKYGPGDGFVTKYGLGDEYYSEYGPGD